MTNNQVSTLYLGFMSRYPQERPRFNKFMAIHSEQQLALSSDGASNLRLETQSKRCPLYAEVMSIFQGKSLLN